MLIGTQFIKMAFVTSQMKFTTHATTWINLVDIMLSEISKSQKDKYRIFHFHEIPSVVRFIETGSRMVVAVDGWGRRNGSCSE